MAQTGFTPIQLYSSSTPTNAPSASNLTNDTKGSELAINITDGKLFYKDNANAVQVIGWKTTPTTAGGTGLTSYTAGDLSYYASGTTFTKLAIGTAGQILTSTGTAPQWTTLSGVAVTTFSAGTTGFTPNSATSGAVTLAGTLAVGNGGTGTSTAFTAGSVVFAGASGVYSQDNTNFFWDDTNNRLGLGTTSPGFTLEVVNNSTGVQSRIASSSSSGTSFSMVNTAANGRSWRIGGNYVIGNGEWSLYDDTAAREVLRATSTGDVNVVTGNLVIGTSGKGIDFSATPGTGTSELFADYEEGDWTPQLFNTITSPTITYTQQTGRYIKIGKMVFVAFKISISGVSGAQSGTPRMTVPFDGLNVPNHYMAGGTAAYFNAVTGSNGYLSIEVSRAIIPNGTAIAAGDFFGSLVYEVA
jgi:hypothetical protein